MSNDAQNSATNLAVIQRYVQALRTGNRAAAVENYHADFTLHWFGHRLAGNHVGRNAALQALSEFTRRTNRKFVDIFGVMAGPDRAAMITREAFSRGDDKAEVERVLIFTIKDDLLHECWVYDADPSLVDRYLSE